MLRCGFPIASLRFDPGEQQAGAHGVETVDHAAQLALGGRRVPGLRLQGGELEGCSLVQRPGRGGRAQGFERLSAGLGVDGGRTGEERRHEERRDRAPGPRRTLSSFSIPVDRHHGVSTDRCEAFRRR